MLDFYFPFRISKEKQGKRNSYGNFRHRNNNDIKQNRHEG